MLKLIKMPIERRNRVIKGLLFRRTVDWLVKRQPLLRKVAMNQKRVRKSITTTRPISRGREKETAQEPRWLALGEKNLLRNSSRRSERLQSH